MSQFSTSHAIFTVSDLLERKANETEKQQGFVLVLKLTNSIQ
tara:strand:+ start:2117 stop:2242 length:126 start_codon:yes stop_codon:yes gene_type:complete